MRAEGSPPAWEGPCTALLCQRSGARFDPPFPYGRDKAFVVALVLIGVCTREECDRPIEVVAPPEIGGNRNPIAAAGIEASRCTFTSSWSTCHRPPAMPVMTSPS